MNKYGAKKTIVDGITFASRRESEVYRDLKVMLKAKLIASFTCQPPFQLLPKPNGVKYIADFLVTYPDGRQEAWDVKGVETEVFKIKAKFYRRMFPAIPLKIIK